MMIFIKIIKQFFKDNVSLNMLIVGYILYLALVYVALTLSIYILFVLHLEANNVKPNVTINTIILIISASIALNIAIIHTLIANYYGKETRLNLFTITKVNINTVVNLNLLYTILVTIILYKTHSCPYYKTTIVSLQFFGIKVPLFFISLPLIFYLSYYNRNLITIKKIISYYYYNPRKHKTLYNYLISTVALINIFIILYIVLNLFAHQIIIFKYKEILVLSTDSSFRWFIEYLDKSFIDFCHKKDPISDELLDYYLKIGTERKILWFDNWHIVTCNTCIKENININPDCYKYEVIDEYLDLQFENFYEEKHKDYIQRIKNAIFF